MGLIRNLFSTAVDVATIPLAVTLDAVNEVSSAFDFAGEKEKSKATKENVERLLKDLEKSIRDVL
jgi:hypothetical protein